MEACNNADGLNLFHCALSNAAAALDAMSSAELFEALKASSRLHSRVVDAVSLGSAPVGAEVGGEDRRQGCGGIDADGDEDDFVALESELILGSGLAMATAAAAAATAPLQEQQRGTAIAAAAAEVTVSACKRVKLECQEQRQDEVSEAGASEAADEEYGGVEDYGIIADPKDGGFIIPGFTILQSDASKLGTPAPYALLNSAWQARLIAALSRTRAAGWATRCSGDN